MAVAYGNLLERLQTAARGCWHQQSRKAEARGRRALPEVLEDLLQLPCLAVASLLASKALSSLRLHHAPACFAQQRQRISSPPGLLLALRSQAVLSAPHLVHGLVHVHGDVEPVQHMERLTGFTQ